MTATTVKPATPGLARRAARRATKPARDHLRRATRTVLAYAASFGAAAVAVAALPRSWLVAAAALVTLTVAAWHAREKTSWRKHSGLLAVRRRRRAQGFASRRDLRRHMSLHAARKRIHVTRPSLAGVRGLPPSEYADRIGAASGIDLYASHEEFIVADGPSRSGKTGLFAGMLADAPGFAFSATTSPDMWQHTYLARKARGPVAILNTEPGSDIPTTLAFNPVAGCETSAGATLTAGYLIDAARDKDGKDSWWDDRGAELLRWMLRAGAHGRAPVTVVRRWCKDPYSREPLSILAAAAPDWAESLDGLLCKPPEFVGHVANSADAALAWLEDDDLKAVACPRDSWEGLDLRQMLAEGGTVYVIGTDRPHASAAPLFALLGARMFDTAKELAHSMPGARLDPPATFVVDEPAITFRVPLDKWCAEAARNGIRLRVGFQSPAQRKLWGEDGGQVIFDNATTYLAFGGFKDAQFLEGLSQVCDDIDIRRPGKSDAAVLATRRLLSAGAIRQIPKGQALLLHGGMRPAIPAVDMVWDRPGYRKATLADVPAPAARPALTWAQRDALTRGLLYLVLLRAAKSRAIARPRMAIAPPYTPAEEVPACRT